MGTTNTRRFISVAAAIAVGLTLATVFAQTSSKRTAQTPSRYLPEYTASGDLILPKNFHEWVYVGSPFTPNALNGGMAGFPEFHNVYIEPGSYEIYKKTQPVPRRDDLFQGAAACAAGNEPRRFANRAFRAGLFPRTV